MRWEEQSGILILIGVVFNNGIIGKVIGWATTNYAKNIIGI